MAATTFNNIADLKKQPVAGGFPQPVQAQMQQLKPKRPRPKVKYPDPKQK